MYHPKNYSWFISRCSGDTGRTTPSSRWSYNPPADSTPKSNTVASNQSNPFKITFWDHTWMRPFVVEDREVDFNKKLREVTDLKVTKPAGLPYYLELAGLK